MRHFDRNNLVDVPEQLKHSERYTEAEVALEICNLLYFKITCSTSSPDSQTFNGKNMITRQLQNKNPVSQRRLVLWPTVQP